MRTPLACVAKKVATHTCGPRVSGPDTSSCTTKIPIQAASANWARLKTNLIGGSRRSSRRVSEVPTRTPASRSIGVAKISPNTSGMSPSEKEWALRRNWRWTTQRSATKNAGASIHQASRGLSSAGSPVSTVRKTAVAAPMSSRFSHQTGLMPSGRDLPPGAAGFLVRRDRICQWAASALERCFLTARRRFRAIAPGCSEGKLETGLAAG